ncbi:MAG: ribosome small subunit-dependent GTPase A [Chitinispirillaceae bacterium]
MPEPLPRLSGRIIEERKNYYTVSTSIGTVRSTLKGVLKKKKRKIATGDLVYIDIINPDSMEGVITGIQNRTSFLPRPPLANISQVVFINCYKNPGLNFEAVDRFLFSATAYNIDAILTFNKTDLLTDEESAELKKTEKYYSGIGYTTLRTSAVNRQGIDELVSICTNKTSAFTGLSGVGKSTLLSSIFPDIEFKTSEVSGRSGRGTHTTTHTTLLSLDNQTFIADTPGFAFVDVPTVPEETVISHFPELEKVTGECRYNDCRHDQEPGCKVKELVDSGEIAPWRHSHYLKIHKEMQERRKNYRKR